MSRQRYLAGVFEGSNGGYPVGRGKIGATGMMKPLAQSLCKNGHAVHLFVDADEERAAVAWHNGLLSMRSAACRFRQSNTWETVYVLTSCYRRIVYKVVAVPVIPGHPVNGTPLPLLYATAPSTTWIPSGNAASNGFSMIVGSAFHTFAPRERP